MIKIRLDPTLTVRVIVMRKGATVIWQIIPYICGVTGQFRLKLMNNFHDVKVHLC